MPGDWLVALSATLLEVPAELVQRPSLRCNGLDAEVV